MTIHQTIQHDALRWIPAENLHLTVLFLGDLPATEISSIIDRLTHVKLVAPFSMQLLPTIRAVHRKGHTEMLWAEFEASLPFAKLCFRVAEALDHPLDREPHPHVTLARTRKEYKGRISPEGFPAIEPLPLQVEYIELWESQLLPQGAQYQPLNRFYLKEQPS